MTPKALIKLQDDLESSMKSGKSDRVGNLRFIIAAVKRFEIDTYPPSVRRAQASGEASPPSKGGEFTDEDVTKVLQKLAKQHRESIEAYQKAGRDDLVAKEKDQLAVVEQYLPKQLSDDEIRVIVKSIVDNEFKDFGAVMGIAMGKLKGKADGKRVSALVKEMLS